MRIAAGCLLALVVAGCALAPPEPGYQNPLLPFEFADPAVMKAPDNRYYAYATQGAPAGRVLNIQVARSEDLVRWEHLGDALPVKPEWGRTKQWFWAPHVLYDAGSGRYFMYYSAEPDDARGKCLAVATATRPEGPFVDSGKPLLCGSGIEHIDPMAFDDPQTGRRLLYWGSGRFPIQVRALSADRLRFDPSSPAMAVLHPSGRPYRALIEAAWMSYRDGWYYLFFSGDRCCAENPSYAVLVARSRSAEGPFEERDAPVLERSDVWLAPGHCAVVRDQDNADWMLYHAMDTRQRGNARLLALDPISYVDGWPMVEGPSILQRRAPRAGPISPRAPFDNPGTGLP